MKDEVKIKWVKKAKRWCRTTITYENNKKKFKQEWLTEKP